MSLKGKIKFYRRLDVRMAFWYTITFLTTILIIFGFLDYRFQHNLLKEIDRMLIDETHEIINQILKHPLSIKEKLKSQEEIVAKRRYYPIAFQVFDHQLNLIYTCSKLPGFIFPKPSLDEKNFIIPVLKKSVKGSRKNLPFRLHTYFYREGSKLKYVVQVATELKIMRKSVENFRENLMVAFVVAFLFGSVGGWILSRKNLKPIDTLTEAIKRINANQLNERLPIQGIDDELDRLALTVNEMIERVEEYLKKLTQFTADAAHELRTPITALKGETEVLLSRKRSSEEYQEALINNLERLDYLTRLINNLLLLSQADEGKASLEFKTINLTNLLRELQEAFFLVAEQKKINLSFTGGKEIFLEGDWLRLTQLFSNLIDNAIKNTPEGGEVALELQEENKEVKIRVKDTGMGISPEDLPYIFDRFYRVDKSRSRDSGGVGLGLSICQWIVRAHQGTIEVESIPQQGTTFTVTLPILLS